MRGQHLALLNIGSQAAFKSLCFSLLHIAYIVTQLSICRCGKLMTTVVAQSHQAARNIMGAISAAIAPFWSLNRFYSGGRLLVHSRKVELCHGKVVARQQLLPSPELRAVVARQQQRPAAGKYDFSFTGYGDSHELNLLPLPATARGSRSSAAATCSNHAWYVWISGHVGTENFKTPSISGIACNHCSDSSSEFQCHQQPCLGSRRQK